MRKRRKRQEPRSCGGICFTVTAQFTQGGEEIFDGFIVRSGISAQSSDVEGTFPLLGDDLLNRRVGFEVVPWIVKLSVHPKQLVPSRKNSEHCASRTRLST